LVEKVRRVCGAVLFAGVWWAMLTFFVVDSFGIREILLLLLFGCLVLSLQQWWAQ